MAFPELCDVVGPDALRKPRVSCVAPRLDFLRELPVRDRVGAGARALQRLNEVARSWVSLFAGGQRCGLR